MYLAPDNNNRPDPTVREVQYMLNSIRLNFHHNWEYLTEDGIYGKKSAQTVKKYQEYRGISSQMSSLGPILGDTTISYIRDSYSYVPKLIPAPASSETKPQKGRFRDTIKIDEVCAGLLATYNDFLNSTLKRIQSLAINNPQALKSMYWDMATKYEPQLNKLKTKLQEAFDSKGEKRKKRNASAKSSRHHLVRELRKFDIVTKIEKFLESKGLKGKIELKALKGKGNFNFKGGGLLQLYAYKDIIYDLLQITEYGTEEWKEDFLKDLSNLIDSLITGVVSTVLAELAVAGAIALTGATISVGWIVVIVAIVATIIGLVISYLMYKTDFSFGDLALEGYNQIIATIKI